MKREPEEGEEEGHSHEDADGKVQQRDEEIHEVLSVRDDGRIYKKDDGDKREQHWKVKKKVVSTKIEPPTGEMRRFVSLCL